jgi:hypothetical protein
MSNQDIAELITMVAATEEQIDKTEKQLEHAREHWINRIHPFRRYRLNKVEADIIEQRSNMEIAKEYIQMLMALRKIES